MVTKRTLVDCMSSVEDPRIDRTKSHQLIDILVLSVLAVLCGAEGWEDIEDFGNIRINWLRKFIKLRNGIPSHDTISRVLHMIKPHEFQEAFNEWVESLAIGASGINLVAIDGKSLRRSYCKKSKLKMLHTVSAWSVTNRILLGCEAVDSKSNEITAIPELLKKLELNGAIFTMDAMGSQKEIASQIVEGGGDYVLAIKNNHPTLAKAMADYFDEAHENGIEKSDMRHHKTNVEAHGRIENRYYYQGPIPECLRPLTRDWIGAKSIGQVHSITVRDGKETAEVRYYISSLESGVKKFAQAVRGHWGIETSLNWVLDMTFAEDQSRIRRGNGPMNFALLRRFAITILSRDTSKKSMRKKRKHAAWDENYLLSALTNTF